MKVKRFSMDVMDKPGKVKKLTAADLDQQRRITMVGNNNINNNETSNGMINNGA
jgi:hypothetical protein